MNTTIAGRFRDTNILARIGSMSEADHGWQVQTYFDDNSLVGGQPGLRVDRQTFDIDYRQYATLGSNDEHVLMWGAGFRHTRDDVMAAPTLTFMTLEEELDTVSAFVQDTITLREDELFAMIGSKIQHNDYTDWEIQPSARVWWTPDEKNTVWGAVSRPVRTPSRTNSDVLLTSAFADPSILAGGPPSGLSIPLAIAGNPMAVSEELLSFEAGYRVQPLDGLVVDIATYLNKYERLSYAPIPAGVFAHDADADTYGVEISSSYDICENLHIAGSYTVFQFDPQDAVARAQFDNDTPQQQVQLRAFYDLTDDIEINGAAYWVDGISSVGIDDYFRLDIGVTWRPKPNIEISVWGQNLTEHRHVEDLDTFFQASPIEVERSVYGQISFRY